MKDKKQSLAGIVSIVFAGLNVLGVLVSTGYTLHIRHQFVQIYDDLGADLPALTQMILNVHWTLWVFVSLFCLAVLILKELIEKKWIPLLLNGFFVLIGIAYWVLFSTALMIPFMQVIQQMENG